MAMIRVCWAVCVLLWMATIGAVIVAIGGELIGGLAMPSLTLGAKKGVKVAPPLHIAEVVAGIVPEPLRATFGLWQWLIYGGAILFTILPIILRVRLMRRHRTRPVVLAQSITSIEIKPPFEEVGDWRRALDLSSGLYTTYAALPHHTARARDDAKGLWSSLGMMSDTERGICFTATFPAPPAPAPPDAPPASDTPSAKPKRPDPYAVPAGLGQTFLDMLKTTHPWADARMSDTDPLERADPPTPDPSGFNPRIGDCPTGREDRCIVDTVAAIGRAVHAVAYRLGQGERGARPPRRSGAETRSFGRCRRGGVRGRDRVGRACQSVSAHGASGDGADDRPIS